MSLMEHLTKLYLLDRQVRGLRTRLENARRYDRTQAGRLSDIDHRLEELKTQKRQCQSRNGALETEGAAMDAQMEKFRGDLNTASTNKQYTAVLTELNAVKEARGKIDDAVLNGMVEVDRIESELAAVTTERAERAKVRDRAGAQLAEHEAEVGSRLDELEMERQAAADAVPTSALVVFEEMADMYDGQAMASVVEVDRRRREYVCGECNMHMPFNQVSALMSPAAKTLIRCTACGRILYIQEEVRASLAPK